MRNGWIRHCNWTTASAAVNPRTTANTGCTSASATRLEEYQMLTELTHIYKFHIQPATWLDAKKVCEDEGSHLVILNSEAESAAVKALHVNNKQDIVGADHTWVSWVGVRESLTENSQYVTVLGQRLQDTGFNRWGGHDNHSSLGDVLFIDSDDGGLGDWPAASNYKLGFTCETCS